MCPARVDRPGTTQPRRPRRAPHQRDQQQEDPRRHQEHVVRRAGVGLLVDQPLDLRQRGLENLGGILGEYLDGLPYVSDIATLDRATWRNMGGGAQTELLDTLESRLRLYQDFNRTPELWHSFDGGRDPGEAVYPVPLSALP